MSYRKQRTLPNIPGNVYFLCGTNAPYMTKFINWKEPEKMFVSRHCDKSIPSDCDICKKDHLEANRYHTSKGYIPKWKRTLREIQFVKKCAYQNCNTTNDNENLINPSFESTSAICGFLHTNTSNFDSLVVCHKHYTLMYRALNPITKCASCGANPKVGTFNCHSPNASLVNAHFHGTFENANDIQPEDVLCYRCYKVHLIIVKNHDKQLSNWKQSTASGRYNDFDRGIQ